MAETPEVTRDRGGEAPATVPSHAASFGQILGPEEEKIKQLEGALWDGLGCLAQATRQEPHTGSLLIARFLMQEPIGDRIKQLRDEITELF